MKTNEQQNRNAARALNVQAQITEVSGNRNIQSATFAPWEDYHPDGTVRKTLLSDDSLILKCVIRNRENTGLRFYTNGIRMIVQDAGGVYQTIEWGTNSDVKYLQFYNANKVNTTQIDVPYNQETTFYVTVSHPGRLSVPQPLPSGTTWKSRVHLLLKDGYDYQDVNDIYLAMQQQ
ncbi:MAG: hypothetical protein LUG98_08580 [Tannerellaceae bacterium]|nr:hypothetical protein [Tannerellaceae bacterium]